MKTTNRPSKLAALICALAMSLLLSACATGPGSTAASSGDGGATPEGASASGEPVGKPWITSVLAGNLPSEQPEAKDDLYTHYNYDYLAAHQDEATSTITEHAGELRTSTIEAIKDQSKTGHDLEQLRIFFNQAADTAALEKTGLSEVQPYLDRIDAVASLEEMNALLKASDFPFSPFMLANVSLNDTRANSIVALNPNFVLSNALLYGGTYYQDSDDPQEQESLTEILQGLASYAAADFMTAGMSPDKTMDTATKIIDFEKKHGKHLDSAGMYLNADYGAMAEATRESYFTLDEACAMASNFPLKETLDKMGKGGSETYIVNRAWLEAFNGLWVAENLDDIKLVAKAQVLKETRPYRDPTSMNALIEAAGMHAPDAEEFAYQACTSLDTLGNVVAKTYADDVLGQNAKARLQTLSQNLVDTYKDLVGSTTWIGEDSKQRIIEKLDAMTLNVLEPGSGYFDYSGLELTPTDQGGTLFSNYLKLKQYRYDCESSMIGQPAVAATPWYGLSPTETNAFYDPSSNSINIFPGFVTSAIYNDEMTDAELFAGSGWTIAHEISHGFDYTGSQLDAYGTPNPVFADADVDAFVLKCSTLASYYQGIEVEPGETVDGRLVVGEAAADLSGAQACLELASKTEGFDYEAFFKSLSNLWAEVMTEDALHQRALDVHPINNLRVNVSVQMYDAMYDVYGVAEGDTMYLSPEQRIAIWGPSA